MSSKYMTSIEEYEKTYQTLLEVLADYKKSITNEEEAGVKYTDNKKAAEEKNGLDIYQ